MVSRLLNQTATQMSLSSLTTSMSVVLSSLHMLVSSSDWTDNFSTEVRAGYSELDARVNPLGGTEFGEVQIGVNDATVYLGADDSRHANKLKYDTTFFKLKGTW